MTDSLGIDYSYARPAPATIKAAGYQWVIRYLSADAGKNLSASEAAALLAAGLGIGLVWETTAQRALDGQAAGTQDAAAAVAQLRALGAPAGLPVLVNIGDFAVTTEQIGTIQGYYYGWRHGLEEYEPGSGGYGTGYIIDQLAGGGAIGMWWQNAMDDEGVTGSTVSQHASIYQRVTPAGTINGVKVASPADLPSGSFDEDVTGFGPVAPMWWSTAPAPAPAPDPASAPTPDPPPAPDPAPAPSLVSVELIAAYSDGSTKTVATLPV